PALPRYFATEDLDSAAAQTPAALAGLNLPAHLQFSCVTRCSTCFFQDWHQLRLPRSRPCDRRARRRFLPRKAPPFALCAGATDRGKYWSRSCTARCESCNRSGRYAGCGTRAERPPGTHRARLRASAKGSLPAEAHFGRTSAPTARTRPDRRVEQP